MRKIGTRTRLGAGVATLVMTGAIATASPAVSAPGALPAAEPYRCQVGVSSIAPDGTPIERNLFATVPPTEKSNGLQPLKFWAGRMPRVATTTVGEVGVGDAVRYGHVVIGDRLTRFVYYYDGNGKVHTEYLTPVGGGWSTMRGIEQSSWENTATREGHQHFYALGADGTLSRWKLQTSPSTGTLFTNKQAFPGFSVVKSMALISQTSTYDTFLMNTTGGSLYTARVPISSPMKPIVTKVRSSSWGSFETLLASRCGQYGTLVTGVDTHTGVAQLYAMGHATGASTVIQSIGKAPKPITGTAIHQRGGVPGFGPPLNGE